ncbi:hypothetical protein C4D60_Mb04t06300 [Musa balbisiana]|uniref:Endopeptidase Clp n=1 Tax=Musa balbisiana TaxID=52838 RepID=A0A4S8K9Z4_MUSBA|nr:hypothetical protein C4D60_Mb04t06300 [Musa balbisiana]
MRQARPSLRVAAAGCRMTLSEGWDMSGSTPGAFRMPRFEELDITSMVLRQRIVFLGSQADVSTVCLGLAASMGAFLLAAGTKGKRFCMPNARVMIHQPPGTAGGKATEMGLQIKEMMYYTDCDNFMNPWEAEYGLVDAVIDDGKPRQVAPIAESAPPPKTRVWDL